jgi:hypothetical protein
MEWKPINTVPLDRDVEIAIIDSKDVHVVACPCRLTHHGWIVAESKKRLYWVRPTHWRDLSLNGNSPEPDRGPEFPVTPLF